MAQRLGSAHESLVRSLEAIGAPQPANHGIQGEPSALLAGGKALGEG